MENERELKNEYDVTELKNFAKELQKRNKNVESAIDEFLIKMGSFFDVDIIVVKEKTENGAAIKCTYEWSRKNHILLRGLERRFLDNTWDAWMTRYREGNGCYRFYKGEVCPIILIQQRETESLIQIPVFAANELVMCIDFVDSDRVRDWLAEEPAMKEISAFLYEEFFTKRAPRRDAEVLKRKLDRDALTKLFKIDRFTKKVNDSISGDESGNYTYAIVSSDVANFKYINEKYGYNTGDLILKKMASTLFLKMKGIVSCCREYSDIFLTAVRCDKETTDTDLKKLVDDCNNSFLDEIRSITEDTSIAINSGFAFVGDHGITVEEAITGATAARKAAKDMALYNTSRCCAYESGMIANKARTAELVSNCDRALANHEFEVYFQPKVLCSTYRIVGAEALIRWRKSDGTFVYPDEFIPAFESNGCIRKTDFFVYEYVFKLLRERLDQKLPVIPISMNVSRIHLFNNQFVEYVGGLLEKYKVPADLLEFELTESICLEELPSAVNTLQWLRQKNIKISIDDFGSGYSSLEVLTRLPINVLKLDKVFMKKDLSNNDKIIISSIVEMARLLGLDVICEGVEEDAQRIFLIEACCEKLQGFIYSRPVPVYEFSKMLEKEFGYA
ncbi:MAG: EAL domain-containing protein [Lachnospiraceae bacterium]|nr:EAL domain-containing protein [Lachnospiraceae bacterium]